MNTITLVGNLADTVTTQRTAQGEAFAQFRLATNRKYKDRDGEEKQRTYWHTCVCFGWRAEAVNGLAKGQLVAVIGEMTEREYQDRDNARKWAHEVKVQVTAVVCTAKHAQQ